MMPKGVEHYCQLFHGLMELSVFHSLMSKGIEHRPSPRRYGVAVKEPARAPSIPFANSLFVQWVVAGHVFWFQ